MSIFANRHEEAIEQVWIQLDSHKRECIDASTALSHIEQILTLLESRLEDDLEAMNQSFWADEDIKKQRKPYHHV
jgi:hypothetical protein